MHDSAELLRRYTQQGDQRAFAALVDQHAGLVYSVALRQLYGDAHLAKDITQKVFIDLARKAAELQSRATIDGWLYRASYLSAAATVRGEQRRKRREGSAQAMEQILSENSGSSDWTEARPVLDQAINELTPRDRDAVLLRFYERLSFDELGRVLNISADGARMRVERALHKMRATLARHGLTSTAAALAIGLADQAAAALPAGLATSVTGAAIAGAAQTAGTSLLFRTINFMSATKLGLGIAGLLTLAGISSAIYEGHTARQLEAALTAAGAAHQSDQTTINKLNRQIVQDDQKWADLQKSVAQLQTDIQAARTPRASPGSPTTGAARRAADAAAHAKALADGQSFLAAFPQARDMLTAIGKAQIAFNYGPFLRKANLTPAQTAALLDQTDAQWIQSILVSPNGVHPGDPQLPDQQLQTILGPSGFQQFQDFERVMPIVQVVTQASMLSPTAPFTADQSDQLLQILADASTDYQNGGKASAKTINWTQAIAQSEGVLTAPQVAALNANVQGPQLMDLIHQFYASQRAK